MLSKTYSVIYTISLPNGRSDNFAIFMLCTANGIPTIVIAKIPAAIKLAKHNSQPKNTNHKIFPSTPIALPFPFTTFFQNGASCNEAILKHCFPNGIPTTVMQHIIPAIHQPMAPTKPPKIIQIKFPNSDMNNSPFFYKN